MKFYQWKWMKSSTKQDEDEEDSLYISNSYPFILYAAFQNSRILTLVKLK